MEHRKQIIPEFGPFAGTRIIAAGSLVAMPFAAELFAEFGAEVIEIERPGIGDNFRKLPPFSAKSPYGTSTAWLQEGRNRLSITMELNLNKPGVKDAFFALIKEADIFMENLVWLEKLGIRDEELLEVNPRLVICHVTGYGRPEFGGDPSICNRASFDLCGQAYSGYLYLNGEPEAEAPTLAKPYLNDYVSAMFCAFGVLAAYHHALKTGQGQVVDVAQFEAQARMMCSSFVDYTESNVIPGRTGSTSKNFQPYGIYRTKGGEHIALGVFGKAVYKRFIEVLGLDYDYYTHEECSAGIETVESPKGRELDRKIREYCESRTAEQIEVECAAKKVPASKVNTVKDCYNNFQFKDRGDFVTYKDETEQRDVTAFGIVPKMSATPGMIWRGAPRVGQDTDEVLSKIAGYSEEQIQALRDFGVI